MMSPPGIIAPGFILSRRLAYMGCIGGAVSTGAGEQYAVP